MAKKTEQQQHESALNDANVFIGALYFTEHRQRMYFLNDHAGTYAVLERTKDLNEWVRDIETESTLNYNTVVQVLSDVSNQQYIKALVVAQDREGLERVMDELW